MSTVGKVFVKHTATILPNCANLQVGTLIEVYYEDSNGDYWIRDLSTDRTHEIDREVLEKYWIETGM